MKISRMKIRIKIRKERQFSKGREVCSYLEIKLKLSKEIWKTVITYFDGILS
jgi:hypothetical protein